ncbi:MAG: single-stranded DNA-binding protein [Nocardioides sp.]
MFDCTITVRGWLGADVVLREAGGVPVASFRLACTPRRLNRRTETWVDGETQWYTVSCWRALAENCATSLRRGDPVVVHGRLELRPYVNNNNVEVVSHEIEAAHVGHDLSRGTSVFTRAPRQEPAEHQQTDVSEASGPDGAGAAA